MHFIYSINRPVIAFYLQLKTYLKEALIKHGLKEEFKEKIVGYINLQAALKSHYRNLPKYDIATLVHRMTRGERVGVDFNFNGIGVDKLKELQDILE
uniref:hypothetical protein n=1 Tax=Salmonella sp. s51228 TaxID=3159652 RepID=UPI0039801914